MHRPVSTTYDLYLGGIRAGELTIDATFRGDRYSATSVMRTAGIVGALYKASFEAETEGRLGSEGLQPERFRAVAQMYSDRQTVDMTYRDATPAAVLADPAFVPKPWQIEPTRAGRHARPRLGGADGAGAGAGRRHLRPQRRDL